MLIKCKFNIKQEYVLSFLLIKKGQQKDNRGGKGATGCKEAED